MSAPLVINLRDGSVWERRAVTRDGVARYALAGSCSCSEYLLASESELAAQGIAGSADVLPVPVGPEPLLLSAERLAEIRRAEQAASEGPWWVDTLTERDGSESVGIDAGGDLWIVPCQDLNQANAEFMAGARQDVPDLLADNERLRARVAELEASPLAFADRLDAKSLDNFLISLSSATEHEPMDEAIGRIHELLRWYREAVPVAEESADKLTRLLAPTQSLREDEPAEAQPLMVFRASHDSIAMGLYTTAAEARRHCEEEERRTWTPSQGPTHFDWIEDEEDGVAEMTVWVGGDECATDYVVTGLEVASEYDAEADE